MRASTQLATLCTAVALTATTAVALTAAPAAADPPVDTPRTTSCVMLCLTFHPSDGEPYWMARSQLDVTYTPYWISIFNARTGRRYGICGSGMNCNSLHPVSNCDPVIAYIGSNTITMPPRIVVQTSGVAYPPPYPYC